MSTENGGIGAGACGEPIYPLNSLIDGEGSENGIGLLRFCSVVLLLSYEPDSLINGDRSLAVADASAGLGCGCFS